MNAKAGQKGCGADAGIPLMRSETQGFKESARIVQDSYDPGIGQGFFLVNAYADHERSKTAIEYHEKFEEHRIADEQNWRFGGNK